MLEKDIREITNIPEKEMIFGEEESEQFNKATKCWICNKELVSDGVKIDKVRDHFHFTGRFRGAAHRICNLKYRKPFFTPVVFHNLSGYDSYLFIKNLGFSEGSIECIPNNEERYISFAKKIQVGSYTKKTLKEKENEEEDEEEKYEYENIPIYHQIRFIDSFKFMAMSLDKLVNNLSKDAFVNVKKYYTEDKISLLTRKGVYPNEYMDSADKLKETRLPPKKAFYLRLNDEGITDEDYVHANKVWKVFEMKSLEDYHDLYNQTDVLLLADVFDLYNQTDVLLLADVFFVVSITSWILLTTLQHRI